MDKRRPRSTLYRGMWIALIVALSASVAFWGARIGASFDSGMVAAPPAPASTAVLGAAIIYTDLGPPNPSTLCADESPSASVVTVETYTGVVLSRVNCPVSFTYTPGYEKGTG